MLLPKKTKFRKVRIGKNEGKRLAVTTSPLVTTVCRASSNERITSRQIESARQAMTRYIKRGGKIWIRIFPHTLSPASHLVSRWVAVRVSQNFSSPRSSWHGNVRNEGRD
jgi:ribosomal protein L16